MQVNVKVIFFCKPTKFSHGNISGLFLLQTKNGCLKIFLGEDKNCSVENNTQVPSQNVHKVITKSIKASFLKNPIVSQEILNICQLQI